MNKIGVVGKGFVGGAVVNGFSGVDGFDVKVYDKDPSKSINTLDEVVNHSDYIFVSVPTPSNNDGSINLEILFNCISEIEKTLKDNNPIILIRSTIVPGTSQEIQNRYKKLNFVFNPEFLTEKNANDDFLNQSRFVIGGDRLNTEKVATLYKERFGESSEIIMTDFQTAELTKYVCNLFFATKVSFLNEMKLLADKIDVDWLTLVNGFTKDSRVGESHNDVPGHDGKLGFGGSCFPKDTLALIHFSKQIGVNLNVVNGAWETNLKVRPEKDWEKLKGRAVT